MNHNSEMFFPQTEKNFKDFLKICNLEMTKQHLSTFKEWEHLSYSNGLIFV